VHPAAALAMDDALALAMLSAGCAVAEGALPEREAHPRVFEGLLQLLARLPRGAEMLAAQVRWEAALLAERGAGPERARCAGTGSADGLAFVSPKSGRAVSEEGAGLWKARLLRLPPLLTGEDAGNAEDWRDGLRVTGHFLTRDAFGLHHK